MNQTAPLILTPAVCDALADLRARAALSPVDMPGLVEAMKEPEARAAHLERMRGQSVIIPGPWRFQVVFSHETGHPCGPALHMSMSVERPGRVPSPEAVALVAEQLGFSFPLDGVARWVEEVSGGMLAVNLVQPLSQPGAAPAAGRG